MRFYLIILCVLSTEVFANTIVAVSGEKTPVPINPSLGTLIQFPKPVKTVTPSRFYHISDVGADPLQKVDVKTFQVKPRGAWQMEEVVFILADSTPITLQFLTQAEASKYYSIVLETSLKESGKSRFLGNELAMMRAMLKDEPGGFSRNVVDKVLETEFKDISLTLKRIYSSPQFTGYVLIIKNKLSENKRLNPESFIFDSPSRAVLAQLDKEELSPCPTFGVKPECEAVLRIVVNGPHTRPFKLGMQPDKPAPFLNSNNSEGAIP